MEAEMFISWAVKYLNCLFEVLLLYIFFEAIFPAYEDRRRIVFLESVICAAMIFLVNRAESPLLNLIGVPCIYMLFTWMVFRIRLKLSVPYILFYYIIFAITEFVVLHIYKALEIGVTLEGPRWMFRLFMEKMAVFIIVQAIRKIHRHSPKEGNYPILASLFILPVSALILLSGFLLTGSSAYGYYFVCLGSILLIVSNIVNFWAVEKLLAAETQTKNNEMVALKTELERNHYRRLEEVNQEYAKHLHEMRHIAQTINHFLELEDGEDLRKLALEATSMLEQGSILQKKVYCADPILNAVFMEREKMARESGVGYEVDIQPGVCLDFLNETDKIRIFGNLLDNALEAAGRCGSGEGYVKASLYMGNSDMMVFRLINNFAHKNKKAGNRFLTTKRDKRVHGFGLQNVEELARKYHGFFGITEEKDQFIVMLALSTMEKM